MLKFIELKSGFNHNGPAWIARVVFSRSGRTLYFNGMALKRDHGVHEHANYVDYDTENAYWVSNPKKNGRDRHKKGSGKVLIEAQILSEYLQLVDRSSLDSSRYAITNEIRSFSRREFHDLENMPQSPTPLTSELIDSPFNTSGAQLQSRQSSNEYVRFVVEYKCTESQQALGVLVAAHQVLEEELTSEERSTLQECLIWFNTHLPGPRVLKVPGNRHALSWFKPSASRAVSVMLKLVNLLESKNIPIQLLQTIDPGEIIYEDRWQVVAVPRQID